MMQPPVSISFTVDGTAKPAGSKRGFAYSGKDGRQHVAITDACKGSKTWKSEVKDAARQAYDGPLLGGPLGVRFVFHRHRPKGHYRSGKNSHLLRNIVPLAPTTKPDVLKLARATEDALTGILWIDDSQIVDEHLVKVYCGRDERERLEVQVWQIDVSWQWAWNHLSLPSPVVLSGVGNEKLAS